MKQSIPLILCGTLLCSACNLPTGPKTAVVDVSKVLAASRHARQAQEESRKIQDILQGNLNAIEKKLSTYKEKKLAETCLLESARQLQSRLDAARANLARVMDAGLARVVEAKLDEYDLILPRSGILASRHSMDITDAVLEAFDQSELTWPPLPRQIDDPQLPPDGNADEASGNPASKETPPSEPQRKTNR